MSRSRKELAIKVRKCLRERIASLVSMSSRRWINMDVVVDQKLFQHLPGRYEEVAITALAAELERIFSRYVRAGGTIDGGWRLDVRDNGYLQFPLHPLDQIIELGRGTDS